MRRPLLALLPLLLLPACTTIDAAGLVRPSGEVVNKRGYFEVSHRQIDRQIENGEPRLYEEYTIEFDQNISRSIINVDAISSSVDAGGHVVQLGLDEGDETNQYLVLLSKGQSLSFTVIHENQTGAVLLIGPPA